MINFLPLDSNDYNFVYKERNTYMRHYCTEKRIVNGDISSSFYDCGEFTEYKAVLFKILLGDSFSNYRISIFSKKDVIN